MQGVKTSRTMFRNRRLWMAAGVVCLGGLLGSSLMPGNNSVSPPATAATPTPAIATTVPAPTMLLASTPLPDSALFSSSPNQAFPPTALADTPLPLAAETSTQQAVPTSTPPVTLTSAPEPTQTVTTTATPTATPTPIALVPAELVRVIDGDTYDLLIGGKKERVRIIGVDTPETNAGPICYGQEATDKASELMLAAGGHLLVEKDVSETDRYSRLLRYVWLDTPSGRVMLNQELVRLGYAQVSTFPPDVKYQDRFLAAEREARAANSGLWGDCGGFGVPVARPSATARVANGEPSSAPSSPGDSSGLRYDPNGPDRDCGDFSTHAQAQQFFLAAGGPERDPHRLDADHDGIACETLP